MTCAEREQHAAAMRQANNFRWWWVRLNAQRARNSVAPERRREIARNAVNARWRARAEESMLMGPEREL